MTKAYQILAIIQLLIYGVFCIAEENKPKLTACLKNYYIDFIKAKGTTIFTPDEYIMGLPFDIASDKTGEGLNDKIKNWRNGIYGDKFTILAGFFECFNTFNLDENGQPADIQAKGAAALLWSGKEGEKHTNTIAKKSKDAWIEASRENKPTQTLNDHKVPACESFIGTMYAKLERKPEGIFKLTESQKTMFRGLAFLWFIWNSDPEDHQYTINQYGSIEGYDININPQLASAPIKID